VCGTTAIEFYQSHRDRRKGLPGAWRYWHCRDCGALFQNPMPTVEELREYYAQYEPFAQVSFVASRGSRHPRLRRIAHWFTGDVDPRDFVPAQAGQRLLDFGCGHAPYLLDFRARGVDVAGAEIAPDVVAAYRARGIDVRRIDDPERIPFTDASFDVVYLMQVMEHIRDPHRFMRDARRVLRVGGEVFLALPNGESRWRSAFGTDWVTGWFAPYHLFVHTTRSLRLVAEANGFEFVESWSRTPESWFRLNLKARWRPNSPVVERERLGWLDSLPGRLGVSCGLRLGELVSPEGDCLVVRLRRTS
jgi:SAM-dependent methyltransferase